MPTQSSRWRLSALAGLAAGFAFLITLSAQQRSGSPATALLVYFGTYTGAKSKGIYVSRLDLSSGALSAPQLAAETPSPSFLAVHPAGDFLYAANEIGNFEGKSSGSV